MIYDFINVDSTEELLSIIQMKLTQGWKLDGSTIPYMANPYGKIKYLQRIKSSIPIINEHQTTGLSSCCTTH